MNHRPLRFLVIAVFIELLTPVLCNAQTQIFKVGPAGDYATIGAALSDLLASPQAINWIKINQGFTTTENLSIPATWTTGTIGISGGWDYFFVHQSGDPAATVISGGLAGSVIDIRTAGGSVIIRDLTITQGRSDFGGGFRVEPTGTAAVRLENLAIDSNKATSTGDAQGGGIYADLSDNTTLEILGCDIHDNRANGSLYAAGAGAIIEAAGDAAISIMDSTFRDNIALASSQIACVGLGVFVDDSATATVADCIAEGNTVQDSVPTSILGAGMKAGSRGNAELTIERCSIVDNNVAYLSGYDQVLVTTAEESVTRMTDSIIAGGKGYGINISTSQISKFYGTNLTVAANGRDGILSFQYDTSSVFLSNTISYANTWADLNVYEGTVAQVGNIISINPDFADLPNLDLRVNAGSVAVDNGVADPPGELGTADIRGGIRNIGAAPDAGAYEGDVNLIFSNGFEVTYSGLWSNFVSLPVQ